MRVQIVIVGLHTVFLGSYTFSELCIILYVKQPLRRLADIIPLSYLQQSFSCPQNLIVWKFKDIVENGLELAPWRLEN